MVEDQERVDDPPEVIDVGEAVIETVGAPGGGGVVVGGYGGVVGFHGTPAISASVFIPPVLKTWLNCFSAPILPEVSASDKCCIAKS